MENKTGKPALPVGRYLKYAIGEIVLVVIGILIALQINNWNEEKKQIKEENEILISLKEELKTNSEQLKKSIQVNTEISNHTDSFLLLLRDSTLSSYNEFDLVRSTSYFPNQINMPVLQEILKSENKIVRRKKEIINDLRKLNTNNSEIEKDLFYIDEMYNLRASEFTIKLGLSYKKEESKKRYITINYLLENGYSRRQLISLFELLNNLRNDWIQRQNEMLKKSQLLVEKLNED